MNPTQKLLLGDRLQKEKIALAVEEEAAIATGQKKVRLSENPSKLFPEVDNIFDDKKADIDVALPKITIPNTQKMFKELNNGKLPEGLKLFSGGTDGCNELRFHALQNIGTLKKSNEHFSDYLSSDFAREVLSKNKIKIHLDTGNIYYNNLNMRESLYSFIHSSRTKLKEL